METKWLEDFVSLAETRSFSRSAQLRHVTQPAFSRRIQSLEAWAGTDLVDRSSYPTRLTPAGETLYDQSLEMLQSLQSARAMLRGWHANNGVTLGNPKLGFVCTKQSVDGQDGLEGYYYEYDHALEFDERLVFARHLEAPLFDPDKAPALPVASWPKPRLERAYRNYAMEYVRTAAPAMVQLFGPEDAGYLLHLTGKLIGMQYFDDVALALGQGRGGAKEFASFLTALFDTQDDTAETTASAGGFEIRQQSWKLMADVADYHSASARLLDGLFEGLAAGCGRHIPVRRKSASGKPPFIWAIG